MNRREAVGSLLALASARVWAAEPSVSTLIGSGTAGYSNQQVNNPYGLVIGPDGALYFCDLDNQRIRRLDLKTGIIRTVLGTGRRGDGPEPDPLKCSLSRPHGVFARGRGVLYISDSEAHRIRLLTSE